MIPIIGTMIGSYIIVQCITVTTRSGERAENVLARVVAGFCAIAMVFFITMLWHISDQYQRETTALSAQIRN